MKYMTTDLHQRYAERERQTKN